MTSLDDNKGAYKAAVSIQRVSRQFGKMIAVGDVSLDIAPGEFMSLVGPSGSGKTTLLMMLAGFERPDSGRLYVDGRDITGLAPNHRNIGMVFQKYALFPHRTVAENIAFPLRMRGVGRAERERRVNEALAAVKLDGYGGRMPAQLSGGQQQRVALARAIVFEPPVILMDEPLGALDKKLRQHMQIELKELQGRLNATVIFVTHDQEEALTMSDRIAILDHGRLVQVGSPRDLYQAPATAFVADFVGDMNFISARIVVEQGDKAVAAIGERTVPLHPGDARPADGTKDIKLAVRPEHLLVSPGTSSEGLAGAVERLIFQGSSLSILITLPDAARIRAQVDARSPLAELPAGSPVTVTWPPQYAHVFPSAHAIR